MQNKTNSKIYETKTKTKQKTHTHTQLKVIANFKKTIFKNNNKNCMNIQTKQDSFELAKLFKYIENVT